jgi:hypothetical protein
MKIYMITSCGINSGRIIKHPYEHAGILGNRIAAASAMHHINFDTTAFSRSFSRIYSPHTGAINAPSATISSLSVTPRGAHRTKPTPGRATFKIIVLRWWFRDGLYYPSPSPPGFPHSQEK